MGKNLIVYYSRAGQKEKNEKFHLKNTRTTKMVAEWIHQAVGGDLFCVETAEPYPLDDTLFVDMLRSEDWHHVRRQAREYLATIEGYDTIFVGYPNWAGIVPSVIYSFMEEYYLVGRRVIPFGINEVPAINGNTTELKKICHEATVTEGYFIPVRGRGAYKKAVAEWAKKQVAFKA